MKFCVQCISVKYQLHKSENSPPDLIGVNNPFDPHTWLFFGFPLPNNHIWVSVIDIPVRHKICRSISIFAIPDERSNFLFIDTYTLRKCNIYWSQFQFRFIWGLPLLWKSSPAHWLHECHPPVIKASISIFCIFVFFFHEGLGVWNFALTNPTWSGTSFMVHLRNHLDVQLRLYFSKAPIDSHLGIILSPEMIRSLETFKSTGLCEATWSAPQVGMRWDWWILMSVNYDSTHFQDFQF